MSQTKRLHIGKTGSVDVEFADSAELQTYDKLAREALGECRTSLAMAARFLNAGLWRLPFERAPLSRTLSVGPASLRYDPENVVDRYRADPNELVRDCLHSVLHCAFLHVLDVRHDEFDTWSLACDIAVELCAMQLCGARFPSSGDDERLRAAQRLKESVRTLTAPSLYRVLRHGGPGEALYAEHGLDGRDLEHLRTLFSRDLHDLWAGKGDGDASASGPGRRAPLPDMQAGAGRDDGERGGLDADAGDAVAAEPAGADAGADAGRGSGEGEASDASGRGQRQADEAPLPPEPDEGRPLPAADDRALPPEYDGVREEWERASRRIEAELRAQLAGRGDGSMLANLRAANRKPQDYAEFLKRFATVGEDIRVSHDEFDYVFYTFGLNRYGNMPLVEPLEYAETDRVREFVIALDTSGSCSGERVKRFVERTFDILRNQTSFGDELNVHIVQCDKRLRTATKVTSLRQLESFADSFWVSGGGGTDFRPVFEYVDELVAQGEFRDLRGMVYFTDGYGAFPTRPPGYDVAFAFVDVDGVDVRVPPWAMKVMMDE